MFAAALLVSVSFAFADGNPPGSAAESFDLRCARTVGVPLLIEYESRMKGALSVDVGSGPQSLPMSETRKESFVDEHAAVDDAGSYVRRRTWLEARKTTNQAIDDPPYDGLDVEFSGDGASEQLGIRNARVLPTGILENLQRTSDAFGLHLDLSSEAMIGVAHEFEPRALLCLLLDPTGTIKNTRAQLTLDRVDAEARTAHLSGDLSFDEAGASGGLTYESRYVMEIQVQFALEQHRVALLSYAGTCSAQGTGKFTDKVSGSFEFSGKVISTPIENADARRAKSVRFRPREVRIEENGIAFDLPSCWALVGREGITTSFVDSRVNDENLILQYVHFDEITDPSAPKFRTSFAESMGKSGIKPPVTKAGSFPLGKACAFTGYPAEGKTNQGAVVTAGPYGLVLLQIIGSEVAVKKARADLDAALRSLRRLR